MIPTVGALLALSAALAGACFVKAYGVVFLGRPRTPQAEKAQEVDRFSLAAMFILAALCFVAGVLPGLFIDMLSPVVVDLVGAHLPAQSFLPWASIAPIAQSRSSYNGLLILLFLAVSWHLGGDVHSSLRHPRHARERHLGLRLSQSDPRGAIHQFKLAMPIRRVFGSTVFMVREKVDMPRPGESRASHFHVKVARSGCGTISTARWYVP